MESYQSRSGPAPGSNGDAPKYVQFGAFELKMDTGELRKHGLKIKLQGKPFQILQALLEQPGEVVTREQLRGKLWPADTFVDFESGLNTAANRLRLTLGDSADHPRYVETLARTGYRFIAPVALVTPAYDLAAAPPLRPADPPQIAAAPPVSPLGLTAATPAASRWAWLIPATVICASLLFASWSWFRSAPKTPVFDQVTFRRGVVGSARFTQDGQTVIYSGRFGGDETRRLFLVNVTSPESRSLDIPNAVLAGVSKSGELALLIYDPENPSAGARLARAPLNGGAPMPIAERVALADWVPDGSTLAIVRNEQRSASVEFPIGKEIYRTNAWIDGFRVSPSGDAVAFLEHPVIGDDAGQVTILDRNGKVIAAAQGWGTAAGLAWSPSGREVLFTAARKGAMRELWSVKRSGAVRLVAQVPTSLRVLDVALDGRILIARDTQRLSMLRLEGAEESDISWFDWSRPQDMSRDGNLVLFDETGQGGGPHYMAYIYNVAQRSTTRLGEGRAQALSPDGRWALTLGAQDRTFLSLVPLRAPGQPRKLAGGGIEYQWARFFPEGDRILCAGAAPGQRLRLYVQSTAGGKPLPIQPETYLDMPAISPDGQQLAGLNAQSRIEIFKVGGASRVLQTPVWARPVRWTADGKSLIVATWRGAPSKLFRIDVKSGQATFWRTVGPSDSVGVLASHGVLVSDDGKTVVYGSLRILSELFVAHNWM